LCNSCASLARLVLCFVLLVIAPLDSEARARRRLGDAEDHVDADQPTSRGEAHRVRRVTRPGAGRRQDGGVLADGQRDVLVHV